MNNLKTYTHYLDDDNCIGSIDRDSDLWYANVCEYKLLTDDDYKFLMNERTSEENYVEYKPMTEIEKYMEGCS